MRRLTPLAILFALVGCNSSPDDGEAPPPPKPVAKSTIEAMPPQARQAAQASMDRGNAMAQQMNERMKGSNH